MITGLIAALALGHGTGEGVSAKAEDALVYALLLVTNERSLAPLHLYLPIHVGGPNPRAAWNEVADGKNNEQRGGKSGDGFLRLEVFDVIAHGKRQGLGERIFITGEHGHSKSFHADMERWESNYPPLAAIVFNNVGNQEAVYSDVDRWRFTDVFYGKAHPKLYLLGANYQVSGNGYGASKPSPISSGYGLSGGVESLLSETKLGIEPFGLSGGVGLGVFERLVSRLGAPLGFLPGSMGVVNRGAEAEEAEKVKSHLQDSGRSLDLGRRRLPDGRWGFLICGLVMLLGWWFAKLTDKTR